MNGHRFASAAALLLLAAAMSGAAFAQDDAQKGRQAGEWVIKAAFIYNFISFTEWPADDPADVSKSLTLGVLGTDHFGDTLDGLAKQAAQKGTTLVVKRFATLDQLETCDILFISSSEKDRLPEILDRIHDEPTLTVSDLEQFATNGGMVEFYMDAEKVRFAINVENSKEAGLKLSPQLLRLARIAQSKENS